MNGNPPLLQVQDLRAYFYTRSGVVKAVDGISFTLDRGETLGLVGESGSGKSVTCLCILRLVPKPAGRIIGGRVLFEGVDLLALPESEMRQYRGRRIAMVPQDPLTSLNPVFTIGDQVAEPLRVHQVVDSKGVTGRVLELLRLVRIPEPELRVRDYPHQFSGGMRQRVLGAIAIAPDPALLIADEPTTSLDVTIQAQYLRLLKKLQQRSHLAMIFVTHDMGIVARICDRVAVMYAGRIVEEAPVGHIFDRPAHPYTEALVRSLPRIEHRLRRLPSIEGEPPLPFNLPKGCPFAPRCPKAMPVCRQEYPPMVTIGGPDHKAACWLHVSQR